MRIFKVGLTKLTLGREQVELKSMLLAQQKPRSWGRIAQKVDHRRTTHVDPKSKYLQKSDKSLNAWQGIK